MPRNGSGTYSLPQSSFVAGSVISSSAVNSDFNDIATALTGSLARDGQAGMTGQLKVADGSTVAPAFTFSNETNTGFIRPNAGQIGIVINGIQVGFFSSSGITTTGIVGLMPVGAIISYAGAAAPATWILCFGQAVLRATYTALFAAIGTQYGSGDGSTTFNLPDLRGRLIAGNDGMGGSAAGRLTATYFGTSAIVLGAVGGNESSGLSATNLPGHTHNGSGTTGAMNANASHQHSLPASVIQYTGASAGGGGTLAGTATISATNFTNTDHGHFYSFTTDGGAVGGANHINVQPTLILNKIIYAGV